MPTPDTVHGYSWWSGIDGTIHTLLILGLPVLIMIAVVSVLRHTASAATQAFKAAQEDNSTPDTDTDDETVSTDDPMMPFPGFDPDMYGMVDDNA